MALKEILKEMRTDCGRDVQVMAWADHLEAEFERLRDDLRDALRAQMIGGPEFTDTARCALLWVLWHHQGARSRVGQPIRFALGMGPYDPLSPDQVAMAKGWEALAETRDHR